MKLFYLTLLLCPFLFAMSCEKDDLNDPDPDNNGPVVTDLGHINGLVYDVEDQPLAGVEIKAPLVTGFSKEDGTFLLENVPVGDRVVVTFTKSSFAVNQKTSRVEKDKYSLVKASLSKIGKTTNTDASKDIDISFQGARVKLSANSLKDEDGNLYAGMAKIDATYFDPTSSNYADFFPGDFIGQSASGEEGNLESFGFITVDITSGGKMLDLSDNQEAEISIPLPGEVLARSPSTIPLFYFDDSLGIWKEEGVAELQNGSYVGKVKHFSSWNADIIYVDQTSCLTGRVVDQYGNPIALSHVTGLGINYTGTSKVITDANGRFNLSVKSDSKVAVYAEAYTFPIQILIAISDVSQHNTPPPGGKKDIGDIVIVLPDSTHVDTSNVDSIKNRYYDIVPAFFTGESWVVGRGGEVLHSVNYGQNWDRQAAGTDATLLGVSFITNTQGWICGTNGTIRHTINSGQDWNSVFAQTTNDLWDIQFVDENHGWIVGTVGEILKTTDGGQVWSHESAGTQVTFYDADFINPMQGWVVGTTGKIFYTEDGGINWVAQPSGTALDLHGVSFLGSRLGWVVGLSGTILHTEDGGQTWHAQPSGWPGEDFRSINFSNPLQGVAVGTSGKILSTVNGGKSWEYTQNVTSHNLEKVHTHYNAGYIVGDETILNINLPQAEATKGWEKVNLVINSQEAISKILFTSPQLGWLVGDDGLVLQTSDGGDHWSQISLGLNEDFTDIFFYQNFGWICGNNETIYRSDDDGNSWALVSHNPDYPYTGIPFDKIQFTSIEQGWAKASYFSGDLNFLMTIDTGRTWQQVTTLVISSDQEFHDFTFVNSSTGWATITDPATGNDYLYQTEDGGMTWHVVLSDIYNGFQSLFFLNETYGWMTTVSGDVYRTQDKGNSWTHFETFNPLGSNLFFVDPYIGWSTNYNGLSKTFDGGENWYAQGIASGGSFSPNAIFMIDANNGWASYGYNPPVLYRTQTGGD